ncbi:TRAP transporter permease [Halorubrum laminariae]|uniref:TRAP transporter permease n=1 Tax=Halorubrum laminariae TaxID=1433523 RepID=A0ABD6C1D3_9EURY|nr:TRAP transporter fused permease subunit [Halorubrum laminariae]
MGLVSQRLQQLEATDVLDKSITVSAAILWVFVIWYAITFDLSRAQYGALFLGGAVAVYIFDELKDSFEDDSMLDVILLTVSLIVTMVVTIYINLNFETLHIDRVGYAYSHEYILAAIFVATMIYLAWRSFGRTFLAIMIGSLLYGLFGYVVPGILGHGGLSATRMLLLLVLDITGFYGFLTQLVAAWIALFLLYAGLLEGYGAFDLIFRAAVKTSKYVESGVAQTAVIASAVIGSINGSQTANAGMTGSFTIPMMKENGMKPSTAGGIEAVASTTGQVLPPVMGAGAFIMASLLGIKYVDVIIGGLIPAAIMVVCIIIAVHYVARNQLDDADPTVLLAELDPLTRKDTIVATVKFVIPFLVLIYTLGFLQWTVITSALYTTIAMLITGISFPVVQTGLESKSLGKTVNEAKTTLRQTVSGLRRGAVITAPIAIILASINGVVDILMTTGVPGILTLSMMEISGGLLLIAAIISFVICILLGLGMPTTAAYTVVALLVAPTLINRFMIPELGAHYFVFYGAILSGLTPPIATCAAVAAGIAGADFFRTCYEAVKISAPLFILPFAFIYHPEIVSSTLGVPGITTGFLILVGGLGIIHGINYQFDLDIVLRIVIGGLFTTIGIITMVHPNSSIQTIGAGIIIVMYIGQLLGGSNMKTLRARIGA